MVARLGLNGVAHVAYVLERYGGYAEAVVILIKGVFAYKIALGLVRLFLHAGILAVFFNELIEIHAVRQLGLHLFNYLVDVLGGVALFGLLYKYMLAEAVSFGHGKHAYGVAAADGVGIIGIELGGGFGVFGLLGGKLLVIVGLGVLLGHVHAGIERFHILVAYGCAADVVLYHLQIGVVVPAAALKRRLEQLFLFGILGVLIGYGFVHLGGILGYHLVYLLFEVRLNLSLFLLGQCNAVLLGHYHRQGIVDKVIEHLVLHTLEGFGR